jgi:hypothetical protein
MVLSGGNTTMTEVVPRTEGHGRHPRHSAFFHHPKFGRRKANVGGPEILGALLAVLFTVGGIGGCAAHQRKVVSYESGVLAESAVVPLPASTLRAPETDSAAEGEAQMRVVEQEMLSAGTGDPSKGINIFDWT